MNRNLHHLLSLDLLMTTQHFTTCQHLASINLIILVQERAAMALKPRVKEFYFSLKVYFYLRFFKQLVISVMVYFILTLLNSMQMVMVSN